MGAFLKAVRLAQERGRGCDCDCDCDGDWDGAGGQGPGRAGRDMWPLTRFLFFAFK